MFYPLNYRALCNSYRYNFLFLFTINLNFTTFALVWKNIRLGNMRVKAENRMVTFNSMNPYTTIRNGVQIADMSVKRNQRSLTLSFSYKFKGFKKKEVKEIDTQRFGL